MRRNYFNKPISKRFIDAFPKFKADTEEETQTLYFWETWKNSPFYMEELTEDDLKHIYDHLLAAYYNWHYVYLDDLGIALNTMHIIEEYYPNCKERLKLVKDMRELSIEDFKKSGMNINSTGSNPKVKTNMGELIDLVDAQTADFQLKSQEQALKAKFMALYDGVMEEFIERFKPLFTKLYSGLSDYIYSNPINNENEEEN